MLAPTGPMRRVTEKNEPEPVVAGLLRRVITKNKDLNSTNLHEFVQRDYTNLPKFMQRDYPAPHCGNPGEIGGSRPRGECAGAEVDQVIQGPLDFGEAVPTYDKWTDNPEYRAAQKKAEILAMEWGERHFKELEEGLSDEELLALSYYRVKAYDPVNDYLRVGKIDIDSNYTEEEVRELIPTIEGVLDRSRIPEEIYVYRAMRLSGFEDPKEKIGETFTDPGFVSTTMVPHMTAIWLDQPPETPRFLARIRIPEGTHGAYISHITHKHDFLPEESEILLQRNTGFRITGIGKDGLIEMEIISGD